MASGSDDLLTIHSNNTTERVRVNNSGDVIVGSGVTLSPDGDAFFTGVCTATSFVGALPITNDADNKIITSTGSGGLNAENNLNYNGTKLTLTGSSDSPVVEFINTSGSSNEGDVLKLRASGRGGGVDDTDIFLITNDSDTRTFGVSNAGTVNTTGNIIIASGKGIDFSSQTATSATGASATSEILDHYEEGTWTPTLTTSNGGSYSASYVYGYYTRIGRIVHAHFAFNSYGNQSTDLLGSGSTSDNVTGGGLPFPTAPGGQEYYQGDIGFYALNFPSSLSTGTLNLYAYIGSDTTSFSFKLPRDNAASQQIQVGQFGQGYIRGCFHYLAAY